jgi:hypothetical protein
MCLERPSPATSASGHGKFADHLYHFVFSSIPSHYTKKPNQPPKKVTLYGQARRTPSDTRLETSNWNCASQRARFHPTRRFCAPECRSPAEPIHSFPCLKFAFRVKGIFSLYQVTPVVLSTIPPTSTPLTNCPCDLSSPDSGGQKPSRQWRRFGYHF